MNGRRNIAVLVFGETGQVARCLAERQPNRMRVTYLGRDKADLAGDVDFSGLIDDSRPDLVINAAGYTNVEQAEEEEELAIRVNASALGDMGTACAEAGIPLFHLSTDYVFDGTKSAPRVETDAVGPRSAYGRSKLAGEVALMGTGCRAYIFRTAWVYSRYGKNFLKTMLRLAKTNSTIRVVADQHGNPTSADDIAKALWHAAEMVCSGKEIPLPGLYHMVGTGSTTWYGFAQEIFEAGKKSGFTCPDRLLAIKTSEFPSKVDRPAHSCLDTSKFQKVFGIALPEWRESTRALIQALREGELN